MARLVAWRGIDPDRLDTARLESGPASLSAHGNSLTRDYRLTYLLETGDDWVTRRLDVRVEGRGWWRALRLRRDDDGIWSGQTDSGSEPADLALGLDPTGLDPTLGLDSRGIVDSDALRGALDCDLGLCPLTNTMPVLRHGLVDAARKGLTDPVNLTMAWVSVPDLAVHRSDQSYTPAANESDDTVFLEFRAADFTARIELDGDGLVVNYPFIGRRVFAD
jgi:hypothetical protein